MGTINYHKNTLRVLGLLVLFATVCSFCGIAGAVPHSALAAQVLNNSESSVGQNEASSLPADLSEESVSPLMATLDDEQVRRLLLLELKRRIDENETLQNQERPGKLATLLDSFRGIAQRIRDRMIFLKSGVADVPDELEELLDKVSLARIFHQYNEKRPQML